MRKALVIATPLLCILGVVLRLLSAGNQSAYSVTVGGHSISYIVILSVITVLFMLAVLIVTLKNEHAEAKAPKSSGVVLFVSAILFGFDAVIKSIDLLSSEVGFDAVSLVLSIAEFISAIVLVIFACMIFTGFDFKYDKTLLLSLIPLIWMIFKLVYEFLGYTRVANISAHYYHVPMAASIVLFLLYYFKSSASGFSKSTGAVVCLSMPAAFFSFIAVIPAIVDALGDSEAFFFDAVSAFDIACVVLSVFAYIISVKLTFSKENRISEISIDNDDEN